MTAIREDARGLSLGPEAVPYILFAAFAAPTVVSLGHQVWNKESGAHGPIILGTALWLLWRVKDELKANGVPGSPILTGLGLIVSLGFYIFGRAYDFISLEVLGLYGACLSWIHAHVGVRAMLKEWFPLLYLGFIVPPPNWFMDELTAPLKLFVSTVSTDGLSAVGIPIAREGVVLTVAEYTLLVEDACSGMNSLVGLTAISLFYIYLLHNASWRYAMVLVAMVIPIAIAANIVRIVILVLLTYTYGNAVGQGFLHETAGMILFVTALLLVFLLDNLLSRVWRPEGSK